jgi:NAD(P)-dependent dehydrogenase (short-subunit alcohol dehydrogenase family)
MTDELRFEGRVFAITGAGRGLGAAYAELLAARGASLVLNDLGTPSADGGGGSDPSAIRTTVEAIVAAGGDAVANTADITDSGGAESITRDALEAYGRLDGLVNNAGIITTESFDELTPEAVQRQLDVHLFGSLSVTRAAWTELSKRRGRVLFTTSAGMFGSPYTIAYNIAKSAVYGAMRSLATVAAPLGMSVNAVMPGASTRMQSAARDGLSGGGGEEGGVLGSANAAPLIALLLHPQCDVNGEMFTTGRGHVSRVVMASSPGYSDPSATPEAVRANFSRIMDVSDVTVESTLEAHRTRLFSRWN